MARIYLSSIGEDLNAHRAAILRELRQTGHEIVTTHHTTGGTHGWLQACQKDIEDCDVFIGVFAWQYGPIPAVDNPAKKSLIELEFQHATDAGIPCYIFLLDEKVSWPIALIDADRSRITALRKDFCTRKIEKYFEDAAQLVESLSKVLATFAAQHPKSPSITLAAYKKHLRKRRRQIQAELTSSTDRQRLQILKMELQIVADKVENLGQSYENAIALDQQLERALVELHSQCPQAQTKAALQDLRSGDRLKAKQLFQKVIEGAGIGELTIGAAAYQLGQIEESEINYQAAIDYFEKALNFEPTNSSYLSSLGIAYDMVGRYDNAIACYEQALASDVRAYGEVDPHVANNFSNLGSAWNSKGEYDIAIEYYGHALASDLLTYGEDDPEVAQRRRNLALAREAKDIYDKAVGYVERSLTMLKEKLGDDHPDTLLVRQKLESLKGKQ